MTPHEQEARSRRYICKPYCLHPHADGSISLFYGYVDRKFIGTFPREEVLDHILTEHVEVEQQYRAKQAKEELARQSSRNLLDDLGL